LIVVMDEGKIVETGPHDQLMSRQGVYAALVQAQSSRPGPPAGSPSRAPADPAPLSASRPSE